jgi:chromosome segregation ATPase
LNELKEQVILWNGYIDSFAGRLCGSERRIVKEYIGTLQGSAVGHSKALIKAQAETQTAQAALLECKREVDFFKGEKSIFKEYIDTLQSSAFGHRRALQHAQTETKTAQAETQEAELEKAKVESQIAKAELEKAKFKIERLDGALSYEQKRYRKKSKIQREEKLLA